MSAQISRLGYSFRANPPTRVVGQLFPTYLKKYDVSSAPWCPSSWLPDSASCLLHRDTNTRVITIRPTTRVKQRDWLSSGKPADYLNHPRETINKQHGEISGGEGAFDTPECFVYCARAHCRATAIDCFCRLLWRLRANIIEESINTCSPVVESYLCNEQARWHCIGKPKMQNALRSQRYIRISNKNIWRNNRGILRSNRIYNLTYPL